MPARKPPNPLAPGLVTGGSSSGSGVAVAGAATGAVDSAPTAVAVADHPDGDAKAATGADAAGTTGKPVVHDGDADDAADDSENRKK